MFRAVRINPITQIFFLRYLVGHKPRRFHTMDALKDAVNNLAVSESQKQPKKKKERSNWRLQSHPLELNPPPAYFDHHIKIFEKLKAKYDEDVANKPREKIDIISETVMINRRK